MLSLLKKGPSANKVPAEKIQATYGRYRMQALLSVFLGYLAYYIVRNNFTLSTPYLKEQLDLSATQIGLLSSCMLIAYGISKGVMSSLADKASPKVFMACGPGAVRYRQRRVRIQYRILGLRCAGCPERPVSGYGGRPLFITIANWFPRRERGRVGAFWNISHNVGGGIVAPIVGAAFAILGTEHWQSASYIVPACVAVVFAISVLVLGKGSPREEGLPSLAEMMPEEKVVLKTKHGQKAPENMSAFQIFCTYVLRNKNAWYVSFVDVFVYMVRFGMISWLPIYLLTVKHFSKEQMSVAFLFFEWAAIPSTLLAGWLSDKLFKGRRMPLAIICMTLIFICLIGYWKSESLLMVTVFAAIVGCLIYVPQFLASVQTMEIVPSFAVGSAVGLRGFMSYIFGASLGTSLFGVMVDKMGWHGGFYLLMGGIVCCILFCYLSHRGALELEQQRKITEQEEARLALADAQ